MSDKSIDVLNAVCECFGTTKEVLLSKERTRNVADVRHFAAYQIMRKCDFPIKKVAGLMRRDRNTILNSVKVVSDLLAIGDKKFVNMMDKFSNYIPQELTTTYMKIKLNRAQLEGVELLLRVLLNDNKPSNMAERLVYEIVFKLYQKIRAKAEVIGCPRSGYGLSLTSQEAMAYYIYYQNVVIDTTAYTYEALQMQRVFNEIDSSNLKLMIQ